MNAFEQFERQLLDSVSARARLGHVHSLAMLARWRRALVSSGAPLLALALTLVVAFAVGTRLPLRSADTVPPAEQPGAQAHEVTCASCQAFGGQLHASIGQVAVTGRSVAVHYGLPSVHFSASEVAGAA